MYESEACTAQIQQSESRCFDLSLDSYNTLQN